VNKILEWYQEQLGQGWYNRLLPFLSCDDMEKTRKEVLVRRKRSVVMPKSTEMFKAFTLCNWEDTRVVILGVEPYSVAGEATGLAYKAKIDYPSHKVVAEIFEEIQNDVFDKEDNLRLGVINDVSLWANQGILLLNTALTVEKDKPRSHIKLWEAFTSTVITALQEKTGVIYLLWGEEVKKYKHLIDEKHNYILEAEYPNPGRTEEGFKGCNHFSKVNDIITKQNGIECKINW